MFSKMTITQQNVAQAAPSSTSDLLGSFTSNFSKVIVPFNIKITEGFQSVGISEGFGSLIAGVKNMLPSRQELPITQIVDSLMEGSLQGVEDYLTFDPKASKITHIPNTPATSTAKRAIFSEAIVFVIGGGNYQEFHNLMDYSQKSNLIAKNILYGATELLSASQFINELERSHAI
jgi:hypothetical protein